MSLCKVFLVGRLGAPPELRTSSAGNKWSVMSVATNRRAKEGDEWVDKTDWHRVKVFGDRAETCHRLLRRGSLVGVDGELDYERWTDSEGKERFGVSIRARRVDFIRDFGQRPEGPAPEATV
ncbi:MAG: single-stranded DNA-binding protein [Deltaproteobacteria bacterium]|nr:single-stranded DNA-binding protein [Deltaproteobacteria bacterium]